MMLSQEQLAIAKHVENGRDNIQVVARAGTGKTTLIRACLPLMRGPVVVLANNTKIAKEIEAKIRADNNRADVGTFHSFGNRALRRALPDAKLEGKGGKDEAGYFKSDRIIEELSVPEYLKGFVSARRWTSGCSAGFGVRLAVEQPEPVARPGAAPRHRFGPGRRQHRGADAGPRPGDPGRVPVRRQGHQARHHHRPRGVQLRRHALPAGLSSMPRSANTASSRWTRRRTATRCGARWRRAWSGRADA